MGGTSRASGARARGMRNALLSPSSFTPEDEDHLTPTEAMAKLRYTDRKAFWDMAKRKGMPLRRFNSRVIRIPRGKFNVWLTQFDPDGC